MRSSDLLPSSPFFTTTRFVSANFKLFVSSHTRSIHRATIHAVTCSFAARRKTSLLLRLLIEHKTRLLFRHILDWSIPL